MKTNDRIKNNVSGRRYIAVAIAIIMLGGLYADTAIAQGNRHGGERNGNRREQSNRMQEGNRRNDVAIERPNRTRDFNRDQNRGNDNWSNSNRPGNNRNRDYNRNRDRSNDNNGTPDINRNRGYNSTTVNSNRNRNDDSDYGRRGNNYHRDMYTRDRPGYRPDYGYNRRPVYNRYDPCWRYSYLPRRNSYFSSLPSTYFSISFGGFGYRYWDGVFYRPFNNLFTVCAPPVGIYINILPTGYRRIYVHDYPYYYYNGTFYDQRGSNYYVVSPPVGAIVESIPDGYETVVIDGETYYTVDGAQYKPVVVENGEIWYEVIKAN